MRDIIQLLADSAGLNVLIAAHVTGRVSINLNDVTCEQALESILSAEHLQRRRLGHIDIIEPQRDRPLTEHIVTQAFHLVHANAVEVTAQLKREGAALLNTDTVLQADPRTNRIIVSDRPERFDHWRTLIALFDQPVHQIQIEARIVVMREQQARQLGIRWQRDAKADDPTGLVMMSDPHVGTMARIGLGSLAHHRLLNLTLEALESEGESRTLSQPSITTVERQAAVIRQGQQVPYQETSASGATSTRLHDAVLALSATPVVMADERIMLALEIQNDSVADIRLNQLPVIDTNRIQTQVVVRDGETIALGGILTHKQVERMSRTPGLASVPLLGHLFRTQQHHDERAELLVFITPRIVDIPAVAD